MKARAITIAIFIIAILVFTFFALKNTPLLSFVKEDSTENEGGIIDNIMPKNPLSIEAVRAKEYPGSEIKIEEELAPGSNYKRYYASYDSDGLKQYGLLTVPSEASRENRVPALVFAHGYIPPAEYHTQEKYIAYVDSLARSGYVVFKIDYRGHDQSEGSPEGAYFSPGYTTDTLNAAASLRKLPYVNTNKVGLWGHSMAGMIGTRALAAKPDVFQAAVIWGGVIGSYEDLQREWWSKRRPQSFNVTPGQINQNRSSRQSFITRYGEAREGNSFWDSISPTTYINDIKTPIQLDHGEADETVPVELSRIFYKKLTDAGKTAALNTYPGSDHNISQGFNLAMQRTIEFFDKYLKG